MDFDLIMLPCIISVSGTMTEWMKDYVKQLQYNREVTTGLTSDGVSGDLLNAETKLAGVSTCSIHN